MDDDDGDLCINGNSHPRWIDAGKVGIDGKTDDGDNDDDNHDEGMQSDHFITDVLDYEAWKKVQR